MLKKFILHLFLFIFVIWAPPILALNPFVNYPSNPLPFTNTLSGWNETRSYQPTALFENGIFKMWYASYNNQNFKVIYATSNDGIAWTRQSLLDLFPGFDNHDPSILKINSGYRLFFAASTNGGSQNFKIYRIDSVDGINFDPNTRQLVLAPGNSLESNGVTSPFVVFENTTYYLFYECWGGQGFRICMATSADGNTWQRCSNNPIINEVSDGPSILKKDNKYYLFFQSPSGVKLTDSSNSLSCNMVWTSPQIVLPDPNIGPSILDIENQLNLYYTGFSASGIKIHLATSTNPISPTPTNTPTPTATPTPVNKKLIIVPGTFASWNKLAMLHNLSVPQSQWKLLKFVKEYDGLFQTLEYLNYQINEDYFVFNYDWRKKIENIADDLNQYIISNNLDTANLSFVGHSLGGLVSRFYAQKYNVPNLDKLITVGSPHQGTASTYKLVEAGELDKNNTIGWLIQKLYLQAHKKNFKTDKTLITSLIPVSNDLFPIYDFLRDQNNTLISIADMQVKNLSLLSYSHHLSDFFPYLITISGENGENTLEGFFVEPRSTLDILLNNYPDGRPKTNILDLGDNVITKNSSNAGFNPISLAADHSEIVYKKQSISNILSALEIPHNQSDLIEGKSTKTKPSLIFALFSPADMKVKFGGEEFVEEEGLVFIEEASAGNYQLELMGKYPGGKYTVLIGQISENEDKWFEINGEINSLFPFLQTDTYTITFNPNVLLDNPVDQNNILSLFDLLVNRLKAISDDHKNKYLQNAIDKTNLARKEYLRGNFRSSLSHVREVNQAIFKARIGSETQSQNMLFDTLMQVENLYEKVSENGQIVPSTSSLLAKLVGLQKEYYSLENYLLDEKNKKINILDKAISLQQMSEKLAKAEQEWQDNNYSLTDIILLSAENLSNEVK